MIRTEPAKQAGPIGKDEAKALTERIRKAVDGLWSLLLEAHERKAFKALGYPTWEAYVKAEFGMSRQRSYQILDQGRVIEEVRKVTGDLSTTVDISEREARDLKADLPAVKEAIAQRIDHGEKPAEALKAVVEEKRAANEAARDETRAKLLPAVQQQEQAKADAIAARKAPKPAGDGDLIASLEAEIEELREANASLEKELAEVKAEHAKWEDMRLQWERGGFEKVVADLREVISVQATRIERESHDKGSWKRNAEMWRKRAEESGWSNNVVIDLDTLEVVNGR